MNALIDWLGKADDLTVEYDAGVLKTQALPGGVGNWENLPAVIYPFNDNIRDVTDAVWEETVTKADRLDYMMAVCSGTIAGLIDVFYVGEFSLDRASKWGSEEVNRFVKKVAELQGFKGGDLSDAVAYLERKYGLAADKATPQFGGGLQHHLRDFSHHFSLGGLLCSLFTQFTGKVIGTDTNGVLQIVTLADQAFIGRNFEEKVLFGTVNWFFHMVSDMAGSSATAGKGTGIPGPIVSLIKELSALPCFRDKSIGEVEFHVWVSKLFNGTLLGKRDENGKIQEALKFDLRTEIGFLHEVGRQFVPVLINECLVRGLYFIRRLYTALCETEIHSLADLQKINPSDLLPFNNRAIKRMVTIASGTFTAIDMVDAAVRAAIKSKGINPAFLVNFAVRINIAGVGRFIIACKADGRFISEDIREAKEQRDRIVKEYEKMIADLKCLSLDYEQMRALNSVQRLILDYDVYHSTSEDAFAKESWKEDWERLLLESLSLVSDEKDGFFLKQAALYDFINKSKKDPGLYLIALEAMLFKPYYPLTNDEEQNKKLKKLKLDSDYLGERFVEKQQKLTKEELADLRKAYKSAMRTITGSSKNAMIGAAATAAAIIVTGGLASAFAPAIAVALVGQGAAGLSGAALVSYSLATVGGGALAAGGMGIAGGTAIITGGGALLGLLGGTSLSAVTTVNLLANDGDVLCECCKLLAFSREVLIKRFKDEDSVRHIKAAVSSRALEVRNQLDAFQRVADEEQDADEKKKMSIKIKTAKKSLKYLQRAEKELFKLIEKEQSTLPAIPEKLD